MAHNPRYSTARPDNVGPHDPNKDQTDPKAPKRRPEEAYKNETEGQAAAVIPPKGKSGD